MPYTDNSIDNLIIHKFPSTTLFNTAVNAGSIADTDISFVEGANEQRVAANNIVLSASNQAYIYVDGATKSIRLLENYSPENHDHLSITSKGAIKGSSSYGVTTATNDQVAIASGDRLVIGDWSGIGTDAGYPLKLSTISFAANGTRFLREDGSWGTPAGGGGGGGSSVYAWDVTLDTATSPFVQIDSTTYNIKLPENIPSGWIGTASNKAAAGNHTHGNITSGGTITSSVNAASGDYIVLCDQSDHTKIIRSNIQLGSDDKKFLSHDGKWDKPYLSNLADVTITNGASGDALMFDGSGWINSSVSSGGLMVVPFTITSDPNTGDNIVSTTTSIADIINAINNDMCVVGETTIFGNTRLSLDLWYGDSTQRTVVFVLRLGLSYLTLTGLSNKSENIWSADTWTYEEQNANLDSLNDVDADSPSNGEVLGYDANSGTWKPMNVAGGTQINWVEWTYN